jgi:glucarate dehydratase
MQLSRREMILAAASAPALAPLSALSAAGDEPSTAASRTNARNLKIVDLKVTPIALPDPPILAASGCHGPYYLRNIVEITTDAGIVGIGETRGGLDRTEALHAARKHVVGQSPFAYRQFAAAVKELDNAAYAGIELACLDAIGRATGLRLCELLGGPVRERVEFAAYLFFRYAADHPVVLDDPRIVDGRGRGEKALDQFGEVRTPQAKAELAWQFHERWGFRVHKLKAGVFPPDMELAALEAISERFRGRHKVRIDPNSRWTMATALRIGKRLKELPLEYYEDPVRSQHDMAAVRRKTGLTMSTNTCVTRFEHIPAAVENRPVDVVLCDHHGWGGITACQALGEIADVVGWRLSQHSNSHAGVTMAAMIHVGAVVPQITLASDTHYVQLVDDADILVGGKLPIKDGFMDVPKAPGLGVEIDRDQLARAHEIYIKSGIRDRDDAALMRKLEPGWQRKPW